MLNKPAETIPVPADTDEVCCDGGSGPMGHPQVFYTFDGKNTVSCGYCGRVFTKTGTKPRH
ncbi:MAG: zinc-finger domain-containing protein [Alphaproteobacteria bacterium]|nr:zinc-finger domain-containing protein [Alphaproteobacteria bacterium]